MIDFNELLMKLFFEIFTQVQIFLTWIVEWPVERTWTNSGLNQINIFINSLFVKWIPWFALIMSLKGSDLLVKLKQAIDWSQFSPAIQ